MSLALLYVTFPDKATACTVARSLLTEGFIACANIFERGHTALYQWEGEIREDKEVAALFKTTQDLATQAQARLVELHPYAVPCVVHLACEAALPAFGAWVEKTLQNVKIPMS